MHRYPGGLKERPAQREHAKDPTSALRRAVYGMLPKNKLRKVCFREVMPELSSKWDHCSNRKPHTHLHRRWEDCAANVPCILPVMTRKKEELLSKRLQCAACPSLQQDTRPEPTQEMAHT